MNAPARPEFFANVALSVSEYVSSYVTTVLRETSYRYYLEGSVKLSSIRRADSLLGYHCSHPNLCNSISLRIRPSIR